MAPGINTKSPCGKIDVLQTSASHLKGAKLKYKCFHVSTLDSSLSYLKTQLYVGIRWTDWGRQQS